MKKCKIIAIIISVVVFGATAYLGFSGMIEGFENSLSGIINPSREINEVFYSFTVLGDTVPDIIIISALVLLPVTCKKVGIPVASTAIISTLLNNTIKNIVCRARPLERLVEVSGFSFPSGHAMNNMAIYLMLFFCILPYCKTKLQKGITLVVLMIFPITMGISRVYFNVHYFSDVVCGWCLGIVLAVVFNEIFKRILDDAKD